MADATPLPRGGTPPAPDANAGAPDKPKPPPVRIREGRTCVAYAVSTPIRVRSTIPSAATDIPAGTSGRAPVRGSTRVLTIAAVGAIEKLSGRNASPV